MLSDSQTNFLYLADTLPKRHPLFYNNFEKILKECNIPYALLRGTKDIWAIDYMPIQIHEERFIQFVYKPSYLMNTIKWRNTISNVDAICKSIGICPMMSNILIDGGNVVRSNNKVIMCNRIFKENPGKEERKLMKEFEELFETDKIIFLPEHPKDTFGHADGIVRFLDEDTVMINECSKDKSEYEWSVSLKAALHNAKLDWIEIPCNFNNEYNKNNEQANGLYINYLQMKDIIVLPVFGLEEDDKAVKAFEENLKGYAIKTLLSNEIAKKGGVLNCITWNIKSRVLQN